MITPYAILISFLMDVSHRKSTICILEMKELENKIKTPLSFFSIFFSCLFNFLECPNFNDFPTKKNNKYQQKIMFIYSCWFCLTIFNFWFFGIIYLKQISKCVRIKLQFCLNEECSKVLSQNFYGFYRFFQMDWWDILFLITQKGLLSF